MISQKALGWRELKTYIASRQRFWFFIFRHFGSSIGCFFDVETFLPGIGWESWKWAFPQWLKSVSSVSALGRIGCTGTRSHFNIFALKLNRGKLVCWNLG
jgi:hypothetical protein